MEGAVPPSAIGTDHAHEPAMTRVPLETRERPRTRRGSLLGIPLAALLAGVRPVPAGALELHTSGRCLYEIAATDASGQKVLQGIACSIDRPGMLVAPLDRVKNSRARWKELRVAPLGEPRDGRARDLSVVTGVLGIDPARNLLLLSAAGVAACDGAGPGGRDPRPGGNGPPPAVAGETLDGLREPLGYSPAAFKATLERRINVPGWPDLILLRLTDGSNTDSGIILDRNGTIIGSILPPPPGADPGTAVAATVDATRLLGQGNGAGKTPSVAIAADGGLSPDDVVLRDFASALLLARPDQIDRAEDLLAAVIAAQGEFPALLLERGVLRFQAGRTESAIRDFSRACEIAPSLALVRYNLGIALGTLQRYDEAADAFRAAVRIDPVYAQAHYQLALTLMASGHPVEARGEREILSALDPRLALDLGALIKP